MKPPPVQRFTARVRGRVQGVGFRYFVHDRARSLGVAGSVRNLRQGCVWVEAEGPRDRLDTLLAALREGPPAARVDHVEVTWEAPVGATRFEIEHS
jgi:acylphosphatase